MAMMLTRSRSAGSSIPEELRLGVGRSRRRPWLAVGSLVVIATCAAAFTSLYSRAGHLTRVLVVARFVPQGSQIEPNDVTADTLSYSSALAPVPAGDLTTVIGRRAAVDLVPGTLLTRTELGAGQSPPRGLALVGVMAKPAQLPAGGVSPGETVDVVLTEPAGTPLSAVASSAAGSAAGSIGPDPYTIVQDVTVSDVEPGESSSGSDTVVTLVVPVAAAGAVANASAAGQAAIVVVAPRA